MGILGFFKCVLYDCILGWEGHSLVVHCNRLRKCMGRREIVEMRILDGVCSNNWIGSVTFV